MHTYTVYCAYICVCAVNRYCTYLYTMLMTQQTLSWVLSKTQDHIQNLSACITIMLGSTNETLRGWNRGWERGRETWGQKNREREREWVSEWVSEGRKSEKEGYVCMCNIMNTVSVRIDVKKRMQLLASAPVRLHPPDPRDQGGVV